MSAAFLPHPPPAPNTHLLYQVSVAREERCSKWNEKKAYQTPHFCFKHLTWMTLQTSFGPTPWERPYGANLKGARPPEALIFITAAPQRLSPWPRSESEFSPFTTTSQLVLLKVIFSFIHFIVCPFLDFVKSPPISIHKWSSKGWVCTSF